MELWVLEAASYLHDIALFDDEQKARRWLAIASLTGSAEPKSSEVASLLRAHHHQLGYHQVKSQDFWCPIGKLQAEVAKCVRAHRFSPDQNLEDLLFSHDYDSVDYAALDATSRTVRTRLLGAILRLADEFDLDSRKTPEEYEETRCIPSEQLCYWHLHKHIASVKLVDGHRLILQFHIGDPAKKSRISEVLSTISSLHFAKLDLEYQRLVNVKNVKVENLPVLDLSGGGSAPDIRWGQPQAHDFSKDSTLFFLSDFEKFLAEKLSEIKVARIVWEHRDEVCKVLQWIKNASPDFQGLFGRIVQRLSFKVPTSLGDLPGRLGLLRNSYELQPVANAMAQHEIWTGYGDGMWEWNEMQWTLASAAYDLFKKGLST
jgi:hypothetical protein